MLVKIHTGQGKGATVTRLSHIISVQVTVPHSHVKCARTLPNHNQRWDNATARKHTPVAVSFCGCRQQNGEHVRCCSNVGALVVLESEASPSSCIVHEAPALRAFPNAKVPSTSTDYDQPLQRRGSEKRFGALRKKWDLCKRVFFGQEARLLIC